MGEERKFERRGKNLHGGNLTFGLTVLSALGSDAILASLTFLRRSSCLVVSVHLRRNIYSFSQKSGHALPSEE